MTDDFCGIQFSAWEALTLAQQSAWTRGLARRARAARSRAIGRALLGLMGGLFGYLARALASAGTPASARR